MDTTQGRWSTHSHRMLLLLLIGGAGCTTMQPVPEPVGEYLQRERPREVRVESESDSSLVVREPQVRDGVLHGSVLREVCGDAADSRRRACVQRLEPVELPLSTLTRLEAARLDRAASWIVGLTVVGFTAGLVYMMVGVQESGLR